MKWSSPQIYVHVNPTLESHKEYISDMYYGVSDLTILVGSDWKRCRGYQDWFVIVDTLDVMYVPDNMNQLVLFCIEHEYDALSKNNTFIGYNNNTISDIITSNETTIPFIDDDLTRDIKIFIL